MKAILYTSKATSAESNASVPKSLPRILNKARKNNSANNISGLLIFRNGRYLQILEGPAARVEHLFKKIKSDKRHEDVLLINEFAIEKQSFKGTGMNLDSDGKYSQQLASFIEMHNEVLQDMPTINCQHLKNHFGINIDQEDDEDEHDSLVFNLNYKNPNEVKRISLANSLFKLKKWPSKVNVQQSRAKYRACVQLSKTESSYHQLLEKCGFVNGDELRSLLTSLRAEGILETRTLQIMEEPSDQNQSDKKEHGELGLYGRVVRLLKP